MPPIPIPEFNDTHARLRIWLRDLAEDKGWEWIAKRAKMHPERIYQIAQGAEPVLLEVDRFRDLHAELNPPNAPDHRMHD